MKTLSFLSLLLWSVISFALVPEEKDYDDAFEGKVAFHQCPLYTVSASFDSEAKKEARSSRGRHALFKVENGKCVEFTCIQANMIGPVDTDVRKKSVRGL